jgi:uncharacterized membrane protein
VKCGVRPVVVAVATAAIAMAAVVAAAAVDRAHVTVAHSAQEAAGGQDNATVQELLTQRCTRCHELSVVSARRASAEEWRETIERMLTYGAQVSEDEMETIVSYLARTQGPQSPAGG